MSIVNEIRSFSIAISLAMTSCTGQGQSLSEQRAVLTTAEVINAGAAIEVQWEPSSTGGGFTIFRRPLGSIVWGTALATLPASAIGYTDNTVLPAVAYEYRVARSSSSIAANGYVSSGIALPPVESRGTMLLVVEAVLNDAIDPAIAQLESDLLADGWFSTRIVVDANATPASVRAQIAAAFSNDPDQVKAVHLLGNVPVPYSGDHAPDGHNFHRGAWACDGYYGDVDGTWTDATVNSNVSNWPWNNNVPGDGKMDQVSFPSALELQVGRVDLSDLPSFGASEVLLTEAYLAKAHAFKTGAFRVPERAVIWDNLQWTNYPLAVSAHMAFAPCVGADQVQVLPNQSPFHQHFLNNDDLLTFQSGAGFLGPLEAPFLGTDGIVTSQLSGASGGGVFNMAIGSYFGDWDNTDNYLRAVLASANGLVHVWSGLPNWFIHPLGMGETIGYCALRTQNNTANDYALANGGWQGQSMGRTHLGLMGDPSLRLRYVAPPTALVVTNDQWSTSFSWQASPDVVDGYLIYRIDDALRTIERISPEPVLGTNVTLPMPFQPGVKYMLRAILQRTTPSGSYHDLSLGAIAISVGVLVADCVGVLGGSAIPGSACDDGMVATEDAVYNADRECLSATTGLQEGSLQPFRIWPSPASDRAFVRGDTAGGIVTVLSSNGTEIHSSRLDGGVHTLDTSNWAAGTYVVQWVPDAAHLSSVRQRSVRAH